MTKDDLTSAIKMDLLRYTQKNSRTDFIKTLLRNPAFKFFYFFRLCQFYKDKNKVKYLLVKLFLVKYKLKYGYQIPSCVDIGCAIKIDHLGSVIINEDAVIGDYITINSSVTIGQTNRGANKGVPTLKNRIWIGANAVIVGNITIGSNVLIAPNAYVNFDVPENSVVIGNPAKIIYNDKATEGYI